MTDDPGLTYIFPTHVPFLPYPDDCELLGLRMIGEYCVCVSFKAFLSLKIVASTWNTMSTNQEKQQIAETNLHLLSVVKFSEMDYKRSLFIT